MEGFGAGTGVAEELLVVPRQLRQPADDVGPEALSLVVRMGGDIGDIGDVGAAGAVPASARPAPTSVSAARTKKTETAGDELTSRQIAAAFTAFDGVPTRFERQPLDELSGFAPELAAMFDWLGTRLGRRRRVLRLLGAVLQPDRRDCPRRGSAPPPPSAGPRGPSGRFRTVRPTARRVAHRPGGRKAYPPARSASARRPGRRCGTTGAADGSIVAPPAGLEPAAKRLEGACSIH